jgi:hypothetical protein
MHPSHKEMAFFTNGWPFLEKEDRPIFAGIFVGFMGGPTTQGVFCGRNLFVKPL